MARPNSPSEHELGAFDGEGATGTEGLCDPSVSSIPCCTHGLTMPPCTFPKSAAGLLVEISLEAAL